MAAHAQLMAAFSKEMADADGEMLAEYGAMDAMALLQDAANTTLQSETLQETVCDAIITNGAV